MRIRFVAVSLLLGSAAIAHAGTIFTAGVHDTLSNVVSCGPGEGPATDVSGPGPAQVGWGCIDGNGSIIGDASSRPGHVGASAASSGLGSISSQGQFSGTMLFSALPGTLNPSDAILTTMTVHVNGSLSVTGKVDLDQFSDAWYFVQIGFAGQAFSFRSTISNANGPSLMSGANIQFSSGGENGDSTTLLVDGDLTTPQILVPIDIPVDISFRIIATAEGFASQANFSNSLDFQTGSDVFTLPSGYTVNSPDLNVADNRFTPSSSTPEPSPLLLMAAPLLYLIRRSARR